MEPKHAFERWSDALEQTNGQSDLESGVKFEVESNKES